MNVRFFATIAFLLILSATAVFLFLRISRKDKTAFQKNIPTQDLNINQPNHMKISSPAFETNAGIPEKYTCDGESISPPLKITAVPAEAKSLALIMDDPDAPVPGGFAHWIVFNFDPKTTDIGENSVPSNAVQGQNGADQSRYTGPCPPTGTHRYFFKLYALDDSLSLGSSVKREDVEQAMAGHILDQSELIGLYQRPQ